MPGDSPIRMKSRPTMVDVARTAGVSTTTVSYVLGGRRGDLKATRISEETRQRVQDAVAAIGYRVNEPARNLRRSRTDRVLLLMDRLSSPYEQHLAAAIQAILIETGRSLSIMVCTSVDQLDIALGMVRKGLADGAIVQCRQLEGQQELLESYAQEHVPMVAISTSLVPSGFDVVSNDEEDAISAAVDHLVARGHRTIAFLAHAAEPRAPETRLRIVRKRLAVHGLSVPDTHVRPGARDRPIAHASTRALLQLAQPPDAIFSASDTGAISAIWAALSLNRRVPDDVAVVGCGNVDECLVTVPTLSSAGPANADFSPIARMLIDRLDTPAFSESRHVYMPWEFFPRSST